MTSNDIANIGALDDMGTVYLYHPVTDEQLEDNDGNPMFIEVYGMDSERYKKVSHQQQNRRIQSAQRSGGKISLTAEQLEASSLDLLAKCTANWHIVLNGEQPVCNEQEARKLYEDVPWIREQVDAFIHDRKNFLAGLSGS